LVADQEMDASDDPRRLVDGAFRAAERDVGGGDLLAEVVGVVVVVVAAAGAVVAAAGAVVAAAGVVVVAGVMVVEVVLVAVTAVVVVVSAGGSVPGCDRATCHVA